MRNDETAAGTLPATLTDSADDRADRVSSPSPTLFIDATGVLRNFGCAPSGIPRVEEFLVRAAFAEADPAVVVVAFDRRRRAFRTLDVFELHLLQDWQNPDPVNAEGGGFTQSVRRVFRFIRRYPTIGRFADRDFAYVAADRSRQGFRYHAAKIMIRAYRLYRRCLAQFTLWFSEPKRRLIDLTQGIVLLSHELVVDPTTSNEFDSARNKAFICHDLIPLLYPHLTFGAVHVDRFAASLRRVMQSPKTTALCTSGTSLSMLTEYTASAGINQARIRQFRLPSALLEKVDHLECTASKIEIKVPFILCCSTIEARKNHLMLARVWQRAIDDGITLPKLLCVGSWGWAVDELTNYLSAHPSLSSHIVFTGPVTDAQLIEYYRRAMFGVLPSLVEGWGYGASECLDFGIPVIVSTAPALREATHGLMPAIDPNDEAGWYAEIRRLSEDAGLRAWYRQQIADRYRPTSTASSWAQVKAALLS